MIIVLAWKTEDILILKAGQPDIGIPPKIKKIEIGKAATWKFDGDENDLKKAIEYSKTPEMFGGVPGQKVFSYPDTEMEPLERARKDILKKD